MVEWLVLLLFNWEVLDSNVDLKVDYPICSFCGYSLSLLANSDIVRSIKPLVPSTSLTAFLFNAL